jgi:CBS domain-containing protein
MLIRDILSSKGSRVVTTHPASTVLEAIELLVQENLGALVVLDDTDVRGIVSERDILRLAARGAQHIGATRVGDIMTSDLIVATPDDPIEYAMEIMTRNRIRHLPILDGGHLAGIISIGDVVNASQRDVEAENKYLKDYIRGVTG